MKRAVLALGLVLLLLASGMAGCRYPGDSRAPPPPPEGPVDLAAFAPSPAARAAPHSFAGRLTLANAQGPHDFAVVHDEFGLAADASQARQRLPDFDLQLVTVGDRLVPLNRGLVMTAHPTWEYSVARGRLWREPGDGDLSRAALPFTLHERNANCVHHGLVTYRFDGRGAVSRAMYQVSSETCQYFKFDAWGMLDTVHEPPGRESAAGLATARAAAESHRLPTHPIDMMAELVPGADPRNFGLASEVDPADMTVYGFVIDGMHFIGGCQSRHGVHPYCDELTLPSYSLAKSLFAGLAVMRAEKLHPGIAATRIGETVDDCRAAPGWGDVSIAHALDMATGNYRSEAWMADEDAAVLDPFFLAEDHATKVAAACRSYPRKAAPGTRWVYHTSDTYLAGVALRAALREELGRDVDLHGELVLDPIYRPLGLSAVAAITRHTYDEAAQPFFGWGQYFQPDDIAKLVTFLGPGKGRIDDAAVLDERMFEATMQRDPSDRGLPADMEGMYYQNGFRALDVSAHLGCSEPAWVVVLSGYGGIIVALFPNDTAYYYFSDGGTHRWLAAARESHRIRAFCTVNSGEMT